MKLQDFQALHDVQSTVALEGLLKTRFENDANSFWLADETGGYPVLGIVVKDELAHVDYLPEEGDAGFTSVGDSRDSLQGETTTFFITKGGEKIWVSNGSVIPFSAALVAAKEFFLSKELPKSLEWLKL